MPRPVVCPHCSEELDIPSEFRGRPVRCAVCQNVFTPPADGAPPAPSLPAPGTWDEDRPSRRPLREDAPPARRVAAREEDDRGYRDRDRDHDLDRDADWDRWDDRRRRRRRGSNTWVWLLVLGVVGLCVLPCGGLLVLGIALDHPSFEPYDSAKGRFTAEFPGKPAETQQTTETGATRYCTEYRRTIPEETYFVHYLDLSGRAGGDKGTDQVLQDACDRTVRNMPGSTEVSRSPTTFGGHPAMDLQVEHPGGTSTIVRFVLAGRRLYSVGITGAGLADESQRLHHFQTAFKIKPPATEK
jgi:hypothetical protein